MIHLLYKVEFFMMIVLTRVMGIILDAHGWWDIIFFYLLQESSFRQNSFKCSSNSFTHREKWYMCSCYLSCNPFMWRNHATIIIIIMRMQIMTTPLVALSVSINLAPIRDINRYRWLFCPFDLLASVNVYGEDATKVE